jgi:hypothetical protein
LEFRKATPDPDAIKTPPKTMQFLLGEAAALFGVPTDEFRRKHIERQAEMMAHVLLSDARDSYIDYLKAEKQKAKDKARTGYDPAAAMRKRYGLVD